MRKTIVLVILSLAVIFGCARVNVGGTKEPIKVDIAMRLDVYQHVQKDIDSIENIVSGDKSAPAKMPENQSFLSVIQPYAYAQESLSPEVEQAALRRKNRLNTLLSLEAKQMVGENKLGLVEIRNQAAADASATGLVNDENNDRMIIYRSLAAKYNQSIEEIQKIYAAKMIQQAPVGTPIEVSNTATGGYEWKTK